nr:TetR/AcrR family transcriptional regulator [Streptomonospora sp. PA3]
MPDPPATSPHTDDAERDARAERILDAAAELLVSWGYRRVTVEDVAKRAGIGKGTVYLHFHTKELLFLTVLLRVQAAMVERLIRAFRDDPEQVRPSALARTNYHMVAEDPIARAMLLGDSETLGSLTSSGVRDLGDFMQARITLMTEYFQTLHDHGILRADAPLELQMHAYFRIFFGYIATEPATESLRSDPLHRVAADADMLAHIIGASLEAPGDDPDRARAAAPRIVALFERLLTRIREEIANQKQT